MSKRKIVKCFFFFNLTIKSLEQPHRCHPPVFIGIFDHALWITYSWLWRVICICLEQNSIGKRHRALKMVSFLVAFEIIFNISKTGYRNKKKIIMSGKVEPSGNKMVYAKGTSLWWRLCIPGFRTIAYIVDKQSCICRKYFLLQGLCVTCAKTTIYVLNRFKMNIFFFKFKWKVLKQINPNLGGFSRGLFVPPCSIETTSLKAIPSFEFAYISCILYIRLFWPISVLTKNLSKRNFKSIHIDTVNNYLFKASDVVLTVFIVNFEQISNLF